MARRWRQYEQGTPQRKLQDAVNAAYPERLEDFFEAVAQALGIQRDSASGTFYAVLRGKRPLPEAHRDLYVELVGVPPAVLDDLAALYAAQHERDPHLNGDGPDLAKELVVLARETIARLDQIEALLRERFKARRAT